MKQKIMDGMINKVCQAVIKKAKVKTKQSSQKIVNSEKESKCGKKKNNAVTQSSDCRKLCQMERREMQREKPLRKRHNKYVKQVGD